MSVLPVQTAWTRVLNTILLFLVALEPYLFNILPFFLSPPQTFSELYYVTSSLYALDIGALYGILALFTHILATEERKLVAPDFLRKYKLSRNLEIVVAIIFLLSAICYSASLGPKRSLHHLGIDILRLSWRKFSERTAETSETAPQSLNFDHLQGQILLAHLRRL
jgi:hypothetical protein